MHACGTGYVMILKYADISALDLAEFQFCEVEEEEEERVGFKSSHKNDQRCVFLSVTVSISVYILLSICV